MSHHYCRRHVSTPPCPPHHCRQSNTTCGSPPSDHVAWGSCTPPSRWSAPAILRTARTLPWPLTNCEWSQKTGTCGPSTIDTSIKRDLERLNWFTSHSKSLHSGSAPEASAPKQKRRDRKTKAIMKNVYDWWMSQFPFPFISWQ